MSSIHRRAFLKAAGGAATVGALSGCLGGGGGGGESGPVVIGAFEPLSGPFTPWGEAHQSGIEFALGEVNDDGGVLGGRNMEVVVEDSGSDPAEADSIFRRLVEQEDAVVATGAVSSDVGVRTAQTAEDLEVANMLHMAGSNAIITPDTTHTFRVGLHPATNIANSQAQLVGDQEFTKVGAVVADYAWGQSFKSAVEDTFPVDVQIEVAPVGASDFKSNLRKFPDDMEMFMSTGHPPGQITLIKQLYELGYEPDVITGAGFPIGVLAGALGDLLTRGFAAYHMHDVTTQEFKDLAGRYAEENDTFMGPNHVYGYVTAKVVASAVENAGSSDPSAIRDALASGEFDTLYPEALAWTDHGEFDDQRLPYSRVEFEAPEYYSGGSFRLNQFFVTDPMPAISPET